jgi:hemerythrin superfamily protein
MGKMHPYTLRQQLKIFIVDPMVGADIDTPAVIVIDALHEVIGKQREEMVEAQAKEMFRFPRFVKVLR